MEEKKKCWNCGAEYEGKFCPNCGAQESNEKKCPKCNSTVNGNARYCTECGYEFKPREKASAIKSFAKNSWAFIVKHKKAIIASAVSVVALTVALVVILSYVTNIFRANKVDNIEIGDTKAQVEKVLGKCHEEELGKWYYYDDAYMDIYSEYKELSEKLLIVSNESQLETIMTRMLELEAEVLVLEYKVIEIQFGGDDLVKSVKYDAAYCPSATETVKWKGDGKGEKIKFDEVYVGDNISSLVAKIYYDDGSYQYSTVNVNKATDSAGTEVDTANVTTSGEYTVTFSDMWGEYSATLEVQALKEFNVDGVIYKGNNQNNFKELVSVENKETLEFVTILDTTEIIGNGAFSSCINLKSVLIPDRATLPSLHPQNNYCTL